MAAPAKAGAPDTYAGYLVHKHGFSPYLSLRPLKDRSLLFRRETACTTFGLFEAFEERSSSGFQFWQIVLHHVPDANAFDTVIYMPQDVADAA